MSSVSMTSNEDCMTVIHLAYEITEKQNINNCFSKGTNMAEVDWLKGCLDRHRNLIIRVLTVPSH